MNILETKRLLLRELVAEDAGFIRQLMNEPAWLRFIGNKNIKTVADAEGYIERGPKAMYARHGFGLWLVALKESGTAVGICGLIKRETLPDVDLGFAFLESHWRNGYAHEATLATIAHGQKMLGLNRIIAILSPDNIASGRLLEKLGFKFERMIRLTDESEEIKLFALARNNSD